MENPCALLRRARQNRSARKMAAAEQPRHTEEKQTPPAHTSSHSSYTALMRSHDRVRTRHTAVKG